MNAFKSNEQFILKEALLVTFKKLYSNDKFTSK